MQESGNFDVLSLIDPNQTYSIGMFHEQYAAAAILSEMLEADRKATSHSCLVATRDSKLES